jgi:putative membrane protein
LDIAGVGTAGAKATTSGLKVTLMLEAYMKTFAIPVAALALLAGARVLAQAVGEKTGINSALDISPTTADFVKEAAISDMLEIEAAKLAESKGNAEEKQFAEQRVNDHTKTSSDLKGMVTSGAVKADTPATLDSASQKKLDELKDAKADDFAGVYDPMQVSAHKDAVSLFQRLKN